jgi:predicted RNA-binding protein with PIN domain
VASPTKTAKKITFIVKRYLTYLKYLTLGPAALKKSELRGLIKEGLISEAEIELYTLKDIYVDSHADLLTAPSRKSVRDYSLNHIQASAGKYIDKFIQKAETDLTQVVENNLQQMRRQAVMGVLTEGAGRKTAKKMAAEIRDKTKDLAKDWDRVVTTELAQATNLGAMDAIIENNKGRTPNEIYVYKSGPHDNLTCKWCSKFWFLRDGETPKVYKLSELAANGSNVGKKTKDWKPTVDLTHPNGRHYLLELPINWGFRNGRLSFISMGHNEYEAQRS